MECCILRGSKEIGGSCVELSFEDERIILDIGLPLDSQKDPKEELPNIKGILKKTNDLKGIIVSHYHQDHCGLLPFVDKNIPIAIGHIAREIINTSAFFMKKDYRIETYVPLENKKSFYLGKFKITPYLVDHSAYDAYALLIEAGDKKLFYTGDLRAHGRKALLFKYLLKNLPQDIDTILMEGTCLGQIDENQNYPTETQIEEDLINSLSKIKGISLIVSSGQNIDRLVSIYRATRRLSKTLVIDPYVASILEATGNKKIPQFNWKGIKIFIPEWQRSLIAKKKSFNITKKYKKQRIFLKDLEKFPNDYVFMFRSSMMMDFDEFPQLLKNGEIIYSQWSGYLKDGTEDNLLAFATRFNLPIQNIHTSGHADIPTLKNLLETTTPKMLVPIHSFEPKQYPTLFKNVEIKSDGEIWTV